MASGNARHEELQPERQQRVRHHHQQRKAEGLDEEFGLGPIAKREGAPQSGNRGRQAFLGQ